MKKAVAVILASVITASALAGCGGKPAGTAEPAVPSPENTAQITEPALQPTAQTEASVEEMTEPLEELFATRQEVVESPEWVAALDAAQDAEQMIVVAGVDKTTAYISMHELRDGIWYRLISTPGFVGKDGLDTDEGYGILTPVGTFTIDKAFGIADDPGCQMEYTKVDDTYYWSGDPDYHYNELVTITDVPELDTSLCEHLVDYQYEYQYALNMGYNAECSPDRGFAFFFHCIGIKRPFTGGCVAVPENIMKFIMQNIRPGCKITIDTIENLGGSL